MTFGTSSGSDFTGSQFSPFGSILNHGSGSATYQGLAPIAFEELAEIFINQTAALSSTHAARAASAYKAIQSLGWRVVPSILRRISDSYESPHWFPLLEDITQDDPVAADEVGDVVAMTRAWLRWWGQQLQVLAA